MSAIAATLLPIIIHSGLPGIAVGLLVDGLRSAGNPLLKMAASAVSRIGHGEPDPPADPDAGNPTEPDLTHLASPKAARKPARRTAASTKTTRTRKR